MNIENVHQFWHNSLERVDINKQKYVMNPDSDFRRNRGFSLSDMIRMQTLRGKEPRADALDVVFGPGPSNHPSASAYTQKMAKMKPDVYIDLLRDLNQQAEDELGKLSPLPKGLKEVSVDGSAFSFESHSRYADDVYRYMPDGNGYQIHVTALRSAYTGLVYDAILQPVHEKNEYSAFCALIDRNIAVPHTLLYLGDRGFTCYRTMAHAQEAQQYYLLRAKDILSRTSFLKNFNLPDEAFDRTLNVCLTRSQAADVQVPEGYIKHRLSPSTAFDFLPKGTKDVYLISFRVVRFRLDNGEWETLVTNLPREMYNADELKEEYIRRWAIEIAFRHIKYANCGEYIHAKKPEFVVFEIFGSLVYYNLTQLLVRCVSVKKKAHLKFEYQVNFKAAAKMVRGLLKRYQPIEDHLVLGSLEVRLIPIRPGRSLPRKKSPWLRIPSCLYR